MTDEKQEDAFLDRLDIDITDVKDELDMEKAMLRNWEHAYNPTTKQVEAIFHATQRKQAIQTESVLESKGKKWTRTPLGRLIPRLASMGIKRKTYVTRGRRTTRYIIPGRAGLFGLSRARQIFGQL